MDAGRFLAADDDLTAPTVAEVVPGRLDRAGHGVGRAEDGPSALTCAAAHRPDPVVLDLTLPGMDGLGVCRRIRARGPVPVVTLTARGDEGDRILGREAGAADYVTKPFGPREPALRVASVPRRSRPAVAARPVHAPGLAATPAAPRATKNATEHGLTLRQFDPSAFLLRHHGRAHSRDEPMREAGAGDFDDLSTGTAHARGPRGEVEEGPAPDRLIQTVWAVGHRLDTTPREEAV
nr:response regulator transcription factor [Streptomyces sp. AC555_RSS877]